ncbi:MAG: hypothetical protein WCK63_03280 [Betaproteobacteria bacterium]
MPTILPGTISGAKPVVTVDITLALFFPGGTPNIAFATHLLTADVIAGETQSVLHTAILSPIFSFGMTVFFVSQG